MNAVNIPIRHEAIIASAGTGKTEQLALRYLSLLLRGVDVGRILALTFTKAAAGEMLERIIVKLAQAACDEGAAQKLSSCLPVRGTLTAARAGELLQRLVNQLPRVRISTLDSFLLHVVRSFALELGWPLSVSLMDEADEARLQMQALAALGARAWRKARMPQNLSAEVQALLQGEAQSRVTEALLEACSYPHRVFLRTQGDARPWHAFVGLQEMSSDEVAAIIEKLASEADADASGRLAEALHRVCESAANGNWENVLKETLVQNVIEGKNTFGKREIPAPVCEMVKNLAEHACAAVLNRAIHATHALFEFLAAFDQELAELKSVQGARGFDDVTRTVGAAADMLRALDAELFFRLDGQIDHVLIDEFQDTSWDQWTALHPLVTEILCEPSGTRSYFMVGDVKQAIYGWRGGEAALMQRVLAHYSRVIETRDLVESWRSGPRLLDVVNRLFTAEGEGDFAERLAEWREFTRFKPHTAAAGAHRGPGYCEVRVVPEAFSANNESEEEGEASGATPCMRAAAALLAEMRPWEYGWRTAVLFRTNAGADRMLTALRAAGVPCYLQGKSRLCENPAVQAVLALLRWADQPEDALAEFHVRSSFLGELVPQSKEGTCNYLAVVRLKLLRRSYPEWIEELVRPVLPRLPEEHRQRLLRLIDVAALYQPRLSPRPADFLQWLEDARQNEPPASEGVVCSTMHNAKGQTYDVVILPDLALNPNQFSNLSMYIAEEHDDASQEVAGVGACSGVRAPRVTCVLRAPRTQEKTVAMLHHSFGQMRAQAEHKKWREYFNLMYVALTRAAQAMYLFCDESRKKSTKNTFARWVLDTLRSDGIGGVSMDSAEMCKGRVWYRTPDGDPEWYRRKPLQVQAPPLSVATAPLARVLIQPVQRHRHQVRPSDHEAPEDASVYFRPQARYAAQFGTAMHALFQRVEWLEAIPPDRELERVLEQVAPQFDAARRAAVVQAFRAACALPEVREVLTRPAEPCEVKTELPFSVLLGTAAVSGVLDRVVCYPSFAAPQRIVIVDFKTDAVRTLEERKARARLYERQITLYREALRAAYGLPEEAVEARLLFVCRGASLATSG